MSSPPELSLSFTHIKTPQLIGIIAGCLVFIATISAVIFLLYKSGTLSRFRDEMVSGTPLSLKTTKKEDIAPQSSMLPELYEHLLIAASTLPLQPIISDLNGEHLSLRTIISSDVPKLIEASNGTALYGESAYDPARIWGWINIKKSQFSVAVTSNVKGWPCDSEKMFTECYLGNVPKSVPQNVPHRDEEHLVIIDRVTQKLVGMISLVDNRPQDLAIRIGEMRLLKSKQNAKFFDFLDENRLIFVVLSGRFQNLF